MLKPGKRLAAAEAELMGKGRNCLRPPSEGWIMGWEGRISAGRRPL